ncbi:AMP-dependent synthetase/ligase [Psychromicrobium lacuslunae]|uniref:Acyl-CoA synthetase n=1 Tax=Psychromicrobium lacuslunae TaxID=1618207 RepID=A0A0D4BVT3_9MICC|nr:AMP-dependent synthetase/ligase [Psychromicrobium lacuslunae]AJT40428.1 long-chain fatty acid--CoA ligase [Psychromicrobium lacuslunae]
MIEASTELLVELPAESNITDLLLERVRLTPAAALYERKINGVWQPVSATDFLKQAKSLAKGLVASGVSSGDAVAVMSKTRYEWSVLDFAIWFAGGITVPIYETSSLSQIEWILADSQAKLVVVEDAEKLSQLRTVITDSKLLGQGPVSLWCIEDDGDSPHLAALAAVGDGISEAELETQRSAANLESVASLVYTSGTTGRPKGCQITHGNFALVAKNTPPFLGELLLTENSRTLMFLPLAHVLARAVQLVSLSAGTTLGHTSGVKELLDDLGNFQPSFLLCVPRIYEKVLDAAQLKAEQSGRGKIFARAVTVAIRFSEAMDRRQRGTSRGASPVLRLQHWCFDKLVYAKLREAFGGKAHYTVSGASALGARQAHFFRGAGVMILEGYGLTETTAPCTANIPSQTRVGTVGIPLPGTTIRIAPDGEILVKGIGVFKGYHANEAATAEAFLDGFFRTGDLGQLDDDGFLTITGRKKDILVTAGGKNIAPGPLEATLRDAPLISQAVLVGEGRPFIAALLTLDVESFERWKQQQGIELSLTDANSSTPLREQLQKAVDAANAGVSRAESIRKFTILPEDFSVESGQLTPSLKVKRATVLQDYQAQIDDLYQP